MKVKEPPGSRPKDAALLAVTLLLALTSCCLSVVSLCRVAVLQAELGSLRTELRGPREPRELRAEPGPPRAGAATPGASGARLAPAVPSALKVSAAAAARPPPPATPAPLRRRGCNLGFLSPQGIFAPAPAGESNSSQSGRRKRAALGPEDTGTFGARKHLADGMPASAGVRVWTPASGLGTPSPPRALTCARRLCKWPLQHVWLLWHSRRAGRCLSPTSGLGRLGPALTTEEGRGHRVFLGWDTPASEALSVTREERRALCPPESRRVR